MFIHHSPLGAMRVDRIHRRDVQAWVDGLRKIDGSIPSPAYVRRSCAFVSRLFTQAVKEGLINHSPATMIELPNVKERRNRVLDYGELGRLVKDPQTEIERMAVVSATLGLSRNEITGIRWDGLRGRLLHVPGTKKESRDRTVPLTADALRAIRRQPRSDERIFPVHPDSISKAWRKRRDELGLPAEVRFQDMRGTYISLLIRSGADVRTVMELAGHTKIETTMKAYARSDFATRTKAVRGMMRKVKQGT